MCSVRQGFFETNVTLKGRGIVRSMKKDYGNFPFLSDIILKHIGVLGKHLSESNWIVSMCFYILKALSAKKTSDMQS